MKRLILILAIAIGTHAVCLAQSEGVRAPLNQLGIIAGLEASKCYDLPVGKRYACVKEAKLLLTDNDCYADSDPAEQRLAWDWLLFASRSPLSAAPHVINRRTGLPLPDPFTRPRFVVKK